MTVVTGHVGDPGEPGGVDWEALARTGGTLVILMGMATRAEIARRLLDGGRAPDTAVAVVHAGTTARSRRVDTRLDGLAEVALDAPCVIVIGPVAALDLRTRQSGRWPAARRRDPPGRRPALVAHPGRRRGQR